MSAEEDDFRVEARMTTVTRGSSATPEYIDELRMRLEKQTRLTQRKPQKGFGEVMASAAAPPEKEGEAPEAPEQPKPAPTPQPGLRRPSERDTYGVVRKTSVVLKG